MAGAFLLDTCALIWAAEDQLSEAAAASLTAARDSGFPILVSPISAWEFGLLIARGRYSAPISPERWFQRATSADGVQLTELSPEILIASSFLPGSPPRDPADRIIAATARATACPVMTRDRVLLAYAEQGHIQALPC